MLKMAIVFLLMLIFFGAGFLIFRMGFFAVVFSFSSKDNISPSEAIVVNYPSFFSLPETYLQSIGIDPEVGFEIKQEKGRIIFEPRDFWPIGEEMTLKFPEGKIGGIIPIYPREVEFQTIDYPKLGSIFPFPGSQDVIMGVEDPIEVDFASSTLGFSVKFETFPGRELIVESDEFKRRFRILPRERFGDGETVGLEISLKYFKEGDSAYRRIYFGNFTTLPPAPLEWDNDPEKRLSQAKRLTRARFSEGKYIDINLKSQVLTLFDKGRVLETFIISSGKRGMETPQGEFHIQNKHPRTWSKQYGLFMPFWMAITPSGKYGIHELPEWPGGYKEGANHLGIPVSHGCVRLGVGAAEKVYDFADIGTKVIVY